MNIFIFLMMNIEEENKRRNTIMETNRFGERGNRDTHVDCKGRETRKDTKRKRLAVKKKEKTQRKSNER